MRFNKLFLLLYLLIKPCYASDEFVDISGRLLKMPLTQGVFKQEKRLKILRNPLISSGIFTYDHSKGIIWKTVTPIPSILLIDELRLLTGQGEQMVPQAFGRVFKAILGGDLDQLSESFIITGENKSVWQLTLTPRDEFLKKIISTISLCGDKDLRSLDIQEVTGNLTHISFTEITHPDQLSNEQTADFERLSP